MGPYFYTYAAVRGFYTRYLRNPVQMRVETEQGSSEGVTAICQNSDPYTYFKDTEVRVCEDVAFDSRSLSLAVLRRARQRDVPSIGARVLNPNWSLTTHRQIDHWSGLAEARIESLSQTEDGGFRPFPVEVDGDYIGEHGELDLRLDAGALTIVA